MTDGLIILTPFDLAFAASLMLLLTVEMGRIATKRESGGGQEREIPNRRASLSCVRSVRRAG